MKYLIPLCLLLTSCATLLTDNHYPVTLKSNVPDVTYQITNSSGRVIDFGKTEDTAILPSSKGYFQPESYSILFSKEGYQQQTIDVKGSIQPWYFGNLIIGGILGMLIIDPLTGAMWKLPATEFVYLQPK